MLALSGLGLTRLSSIHEFYLFAFPGPMSRGAKDCAQLREAARTFTQIKGPGDCRGHTRRAHGRWSAPRDADRYLIRDAQRIIESIDAPVRIHDAPEEDIIYEHAIGNIVCC